MHLASGKLNLKKKHQITGHVNPLSNRPGPLIYSTLNNFRFSFLEAE